MGLYINGINQQAGGGGTVILSGNATPDKVLATYTFYNVDPQGKLTGTMPYNKVDLSPSVLPFDIPLGYYDGSTRILPDSNLVTGNIKSGESIFGVTGKTEVIDTTEIVFPVSAIDISSGRIGFVNGTKITGTAITTLTGTAISAHVLASEKFYSTDATIQLVGTMPNVSADIVPTGLAITIPAGYHDGTKHVTGDTNLVTGNIKSGISIYGVLGKTEVVDTTEGSVPISAEQVLNSRVGYVNGSKIFGTMPDKTGDGIIITPSSIDQAIPVGFYPGAIGDGKVLGDTNLVTGNIKSGISIYGITGTYITPITGNTIAAHVLSGDTFYTTDATSKQTGTMVNKTSSATIITPGTGDQAIPVGFYPGAIGDGKVTGDLDLTPSNIKSGVNIFGVTGIYNGWTRPLDWPDITSPAANTIKLLTSDTGYGTYAFRVTVASSGTYTVDWGDGIIDSSISSGSLAQHSYDLGSGTFTSRGYSTFVVVITATNTITRFYVQPHTLASQNQYQGYLDAEFATTGLTSCLEMFYRNATPKVYCPLLEHFKLTGTVASATDGTNMFANCQNLQSAEVSGITGIQTGSTVFSSCISLTSVDISNWTSLVSGSDMFSGCSALQNVILGSYSNMTSSTTMFYGCSALQSINIVGISNSLNATSMFANCYALKNVSTFGTAFTNTTSMFANCYSMNDFNGAYYGAVTNATSMFNNCYSLRNANISGMTLVATATGMFTNCYSLNTLVGSSVFGRDAASTLADTMLSSAERFTVLDLSTARLTKIGAAGVTGKLNKLTALLFSPSSLFAGASPHIDISYCSFSGNDLSSLFATLPNNMAKTMAVTGTTGIIGANLVSLSGTATSGSKTVTMASTTGLVAGMEMAGTGLSTAVAVTTQGTPNTITRTAHGLPTNTLVYFVTVVTTTGISLYTPYYVINSLANTFQISTSLGGGALDFTTDGSGTILYGNPIVTVTTNVSVTLTTPASASGTITTTSTVALTSIARGKNWTVTP